MTKIPAEKIEAVKLEVDEYLKRYNYTRDDVVVGVDAWIIAGRVGFTHWAYKDRSVHDAHIQTALERIFPNAQFKDPKRY